MDSGSLIIEKRDANQNNACSFWVLFFAADLGDISLDLTLTVALALRRCRLQSRFFRSGILSGIGALSFFGRFFDRHFGFIRQAISASLDDSIARLDAR